MTTTGDWVDELAGSVPIDLGESRPLRVTQEMVDTHAGTTGDAQWIHNDPERARRESPFGGPIAQGFLLTALLTQLSGGLELPDVGPVTMMVNYGFDRVRFLSPVPVDAEVRLRGTLAEVRRKGVHDAVLAIDVELVTDATVAMAARWLFLVVADPNLR